MTSSLCQPLVVAERDRVAGSGQPQQAARELLLTVGHSSLRWSVVVLLASLGLAGCGHAPYRTGEAEPVAAADMGNRLVAELAASMIGTPYRAGGNRPQVGFDCSGLVQYCYRLLGLDLPRNVDAQKLATVPVATADLEVGDLLFFRIGGGVSHVGIYYGDGQFVHAPSSGKAVMRSRLDTAYWQSRLVSGGRPVPGHQPSVGSSPRSSSGEFTNDGRSAAATGALSKKP